MCLIQNTQCTIKQAMMLAIHESRIIHILENPFASNPCATNTNEPVTDISRHKKLQNEEHIYERG